MTIAPDKLEAVQSLFGAVLELAPEKRSEFLMQNSIDPAIREEVMKLLVEHDQAGSFLERPLLEHENVAPLPHAPQFEPGTVLAGRFKLIRFIAAGGMGEVYEAEDHELREHVAIKTIAPSLLGKQHVISQFRREVQMARRVTHPNVCRIFDLFRHVSESGGANDILIVSMELLDGCTLAEWLSRNGRMGVYEAVLLLRQLASALAAAHQNGIVHRDFKPGNVVLVADNEYPSEVRAVVTDFGLAQGSIHSLPTALSLHAATTVEGGICGTPAYMAPEQLQGYPATAASDVYAMGLVAYEILTAVHPHAESNLALQISATLNRVPVHPRVLNPEVPEALDLMIMRALDKDPQKRYGSANAILIQLDSIGAAPGDSPGLAPGIQGRADATAVARDLAESDPSIREASVVESQAKTPRRLIVRISFFLVVLALLLCGTFWEYTKLVQDKKRIVVNPPDPVEHSIEVYLLADPKFDIESIMSERAELRSGSRFQLGIHSSEDGFLYVINQGPASRATNARFVILFPSPSTNGGQASLMHHADVTIPETGYLRLDNRKGEERIWLIWSRYSLPSFEAMKKWANPDDHGLIKDKSAIQILQTFLDQHPIAPVSLAKRENALKLTTTNDTLVYALRLNHE